MNRKQKIQLIQGGTHVIKNDMKFKQEAVTFMYRIGCFNPSLVMLGGTNFLEIVNNEWRGISEHTDSRPHFLMSELVEVESCNAVVQHLDDIREIKDRLHELFPKYKGFIEHTLVAVMCKDYIQSLHPTEPKEVFTVEQVTYAKYELKDGKILKDGHTMFMEDVVKDLKRKSYLESEVKKLNFMVKNGLGHEDMKNDITYPNGF